MTSTDADRKINNPASWQPFPSSHDLVSKYKHDVTQVTQCNVDYLQDGLIKPQTCDLIHVLSYSNGAHMCCRLQKFTISKDNVCVVHTNAKLSNALTGVDVQRPFVHIA